MFSALQTKTISAKKDTKYSCFKTLAFELLSKNGDFSKLNEKIRNSKLKCWVKQTYPRFLISDGSFFMSAFFTKEAFERCHQSKEQNIDITHLQDGLILINKWSLELSLVNSAEEFTSYGGIQIKMIIYDFKVKTED